MNSDEIDNVNQSSYIEIGGNSSDDDTVYIKISIICGQLSHPDEFIFPYEVTVFSQQPLYYFS